jgi:hypothetical protein
MHDTHIVDQYVSFLETLVKTGTHRLKLLTAKDVRHRTPEAETQGPEGSAAMLAALFEDTNQVKYKVLDRAAGQDNRTVYLRWDRLITYPDGSTQALSGINEIMIGMDGKIASIIEHWDTIAPAPRKGVIAKLFRR